MEPTEPIRVINTENTPESTSPEHELSDSERFSQDLKKINAVILEMLMAQDADMQDLQEAWLVRAVLTEDFIDSLVASKDNLNPRPKAQFDVMIDKANILAKAGEEVRYLEELDAAESFALNSNLGEAAISITDELDEKIEKLGTSSEEIILKLRGVLPFSDRDYLREMLQDGMDDEDLRSNVYGMILEEGQDPDEVLVKLGVTE